MKKNVSNIYFIEYVYSSFLSIIIKDRFKISFTIQNIGIA